MCGSGENQAQGSGAAKSGACDSMLQQVEERQQELCSNKCGTKQVLVQHLLSINKQQVEQQQGQVHHLVSFVSSRRKCSKRLQHADDQQEGEVQPGASA